MKWFKKEIKERDVNTWLDVNGKFIFITVHERVYNKTSKTWISQVIERYLSLDAGLTYTPVAQGIIRVGM